MPSKPPSDGAFASAAARAAYAEAHDWPLPEAPYLPGMNARPSGDDMVHRIADSAPNPTDAEKWAENAAYLAGFRLYGGFYGWEAHEVWEPVWMHARPNSPERHLLQGLIQLANARLKLIMERHNAGRRLVAIAADCLGEAAFVSRGAIMGIDSAALHRETRRVAEILAAGRLAETPNLHYNA